MGATSSRPPTSTEQLVVQSTPDFEYAYDFEYKLRKAAREGDLQTMKNLIAKTPARNPKAEYAYVFNEAAKEGQLPVLKYLVSLGFDPIWETFAIYEAASGGHLDIVIYLWQFYRRRDWAYLKNPAWRDSTPAKIRQNLLNEALRRALQRGQLEVVDYLYGQKAFMSVDDATHFLFFIAVNQREALRRIFKYQPEVVHVDNEVLLRHTALRCVFSDPQVCDVVRDVLAAGANIDTALANVRDERETEALKQIVLPLEEQVVLAARRGRPAPVRADGAPEVSGQRLFVLGLGQFVRSGNIPSSDPQWVVYRNRLLEAEAELVDLLIERGLPEELARSVLSYQTEDPGFPQGRSSWQRRVRPRPDLGAQASAVLRFGDLEWPNPRFLAIAAKEARGRALPTPRDFPQFIRDPL